MGTAWLHNKLGEAGRTYEVGDCPGDDIQLVDFEETCLPVRPFESGKPIRVLLAWDCEHCRLGNLAEVVYADGCICSIEATQLTPQTLERVDCLYEDLDDIVESLIDEPVRIGPRWRPDWLRLLRAALAAGRRW
ncbi:MAG TPA: hypothetical protein VNO30_46370 [Kofleriaceae bacterium]|nr:hypothetical protein [Kofleriaceae bacterium]